MIDVFEVDASLWSWKLRDPAAGFSCVAESPLNFASEEDARTNALAVVQGMITAEVIAEAVMSNGS